MKQCFPQLRIVINGGISTLEQAEALLQKVDGVMLGREAYQNPYILHRVDNKFFGMPAREKSRQEYLQQFIPYVQAELDRGTPLRHMARHLMGLFKGQSGGKQFRRHLSEYCHEENAGVNVILDALSFTN